MTREERRLLMEWLDTTSFGPDDGSNLLPPLMPDTDDDDGDM